MRRHRLRVRRSQWSRLIRGQFLPALARGLRIIRSTSRASSHFFAHPFAQFAHVTLVTHRQSRPQIRAPRTALSHEIVSFQASCPLHFGRTIPFDDLPSLGARIGCDGAFAVQPRSQLSPTHKSNDRSNRDHGSKGRHQRLRPHRTQRLPHRSRQPGHRIRSRKRSHHPGDPGSPAQVRLHPRQPASTTSSTATTSSPSTAKRSRSSPSATPPSSTGPA